MPENKGDDRVAIVKSSGNIFADLDVQLDAKDELKIAIAHQICNLIEERGLTQHQASIILGTDQAKVSNITRGRLGGFSVDRLVNFATLLGFDIDVSMKRSKETQGKITVYAPMAATG